MHGFCTVFARFQTVQRVLFDAKSDKECRNYRVKNHVALFKNDDDSKLPSFETNRRLALLISGPRVRVPGGAPNFERQIVRLDVLSLCKKAAAHFLHPICTFGFLQGKKTDMAKPTKSKVEHCNTLQNKKLPDEKVAALFGLKEPAKNAILSSTGAKALSEEIAKRLFCTLRDGFLFYGWVRTSGSPGL